MNALARIISEGSGAAPSPMLSIAGLNVAYRGGAGWTPVVRGVDLALAPGRSLVLLGESGSGKSVTLRAIIGLLREEGARVDGEVRVGGRDVNAMAPDELLKLRGNEVGFIFQEPMTALDPVFRIGDQIAETIVQHRGTSWRQAMATARELFDLVQIPSAERRLKAYPNELSGGLRQRAMIAMAMSCDPRLLLADEPTTALDATVQIQVLLLLREIQKERGTAMVFVTHDLGVAAEIADEVAVMYAGRIVEQGDAAQVLLNPSHPYTHALTGCVVQGSYRDHRLGELAGAPPDLAQLPPGCSFAPRCARRQEDCRLTDPARRPVAPRHDVACLHAADLPAGTAGGR
ncbi:ABC transporter ATP-binding protein [Starkeya koreensis]|uniref:ABC transporter ATP-binding protein n=1 Tax=Ancylobacter koreensis TaxID=266121 RepID=A0ABT0DKB7_9HYPH|nr:ABC transporter ATP-binding protein [Ancylobacter koreensis]MCK0207512.1 ABC transporter ATP-binding protein [Ancylobacter koreensis]